MQKQIPAIQYLRGLAALAVVFCHYGSDLPKYRTLGHIFGYGQLGVHVFFMISGFVIVYALVNNNYHPEYFFRFLLKRSARIDPPYFAAIALTLITFQLLKFLPGFRGSSIPLIPGQLLAHVFYVVPFTRWEFYNHLFWTLGVEFQFYMVIGLLYFLNAGIKFRLMFLLVFSLSAFVQIQNGYYFVFNYAPIFAAGMALMHYYTEKKRLYLLSFMVSMILVYIHFDLTICLLICAAAVAVIYVDLQIRVLHFLGSISYSLYITHALVFIYTTGVLKKLGVGLDTMVLPVLFFKILAAILFACIFYWLIERPAINLSKKLAYKPEKLNR